MKLVNTQWLREQGYTLENCTVQRAGIEIMESTATVRVVLSVPGGGCSLGGRSCDRFILFDKAINGSKYGMDAMLWLMAVTGVEHSSEMAGRYVRVAFDAEDCARFVGHIVKDVWLNFDWLVGGEE